MKIPTINSPNSITISATTYLQLLKAGIVVLFTTLLSLIGYSNTCATATNIACGTNETGTTTGEPNTAIGTCITAQGTGGMDWYTFTGDGFAWTLETVATAGQYDTKIWIFSGNCGGLVCVTGNDDGGAGTLSLVNFTPAAGVTYYVVVGGFGGAEGNYDLTINSAPCNPLPMVYNSSTVTQNTDDVDKCATNAQIIGVEIVSTEILAPLDLTQLRLRTNGSTAPLTDIANVDVYYTGTSPIFATTTFFGNSAPVGVGVNFFVNGTQTLATGTNYFWVVYDMAPGAVVGNTVDARCTRVLVDGINRTPTVTNPGGSRTIIPCAGETPCTALATTVDCGAKTIGNVAGFTDSGIADPGCGNYQGGDVWYELVIPASGEVDLEIKSEAGGAPDVSMAAYTGPACGGPLALLDCDDNGGIGNMPIINLTGLTPGNILYVRIWDPGNDQIGIFDLQCTDASTLYCLTNDATLMAGDTCFQLNPPAGGRGCAWYKNTLDFNQNFDHTIDLYVGNNDGGADGMAFTFHNDPGGSSVCGLAGGSLGSSGILNSLTIEVDTYNNGAIGGEMVDDHVAIYTSVSTYTSPIAGPVSATNPTSNIEDGNTHQLRITWDATTNLLEVYFDGVFRLNIIDDFVTNVFGSNNVYWGSTSSTGFYVNEHYVCPPPTLINPLPVELYAFDVECEPKSARVNWETASEVNNDYFTIERSRDATNFEPVATIIGKGTTTSMSSYSWVDQSPLSGTAYYRLSQTDFDGATEYSPIRSVDCSVGSIHIYPNPTENVLNVEAQRGGTMSIVDVTGKTIMEHEINAGQTSISVAHLSAASYVIRIQLSDGTNHFQNLIKL